MRVICSPRGSPSLETSSHLNTPPKARQGGVQAGKPNFCRGEWRGPGRQYLEEKQKGLQRPQAWVAWKLRQRSCS